MMAGLWQVKRRTNRFPRWAVDANGCEVASVSRLFECETGE
jgi:hypothetical protein